MLFARSAVSRLPVGAGSGAVRELAKKAVRSRKGFDPTRGWARLHERLSEVPVHLPALKKLEAPPARIILQKLYVTRLNKNGSRSTVRWEKEWSPPLRSLRVLCGCGRRLAGVVLPMGD